MKYPPVLQRIAKTTDSAAQAYLRVADGITEVAGWISRAVVLVVIPVGFLNVFLRYVGQYVEVQLVNNTWIEAQWYLYGVIFLLMFPHLLRHDTNVRVDFWYAERSDRAKAWIDLIGHTFGLIPFTILALWVSWKPVRESLVYWEMSPDPGGLPRGPIKLVILVAFILLGIAALASLIRIVAFLSGRQAVLFEKEREAPLRIE